MDAQGNFHVHTRYLSNFQLFKNELYNVHNVKVTYFIINHTHFEAGVRV